MCETELAKFLARTACPRKFSTLDLDGMRPRSSQTYLEALDQIAAVGEVLASRRFLSEPVYLMLTGPFGCGKTRAACWLLRRAYEGVRSNGRCPPGFSPLFMRASTMGDLRFRSFSHGEESEDEDQRAVLRDRLSSCSLLVLDDVARASGYRGEEQFIESVVEQRWEDERSVILTGNVDGEASGADGRRVGLSPRFRDFLRYFEVVALTGNTRRGE